MKIKIIDLLNKSANGESLPLKIKYGGYEFQYDIINNCYVDKNDLMLEDHVNFFSKINDEVEIVEESKKIEKLDNRNYDEINKIYCGKKALGEAEIVDKINEIIDVVNKMIERSE